MLRSPFLGVLRHAWLSFPTQCGCFRRRWCGLIVPDKERFTTAAVLQQAGIPGKKYGVLPPRRDVPNWGWLFERIVTSIGVQYAIQWRVVHRQLMDLGRD